MTGRERMPAATREGGVLKRERSQVLHLFTMVVVLVAGLAIVLGAMLSAAQAAPFSSLKQFRVPTDNSQPRSITNGSDSNRWYTLGTEFVPSKIGRITTSGTILDPIAMPNSNALAGDLAVHGNEVWFTDFNNDNLWRYNVDSGQFDQFDVPEPHDAAGFVWFTAPLEPGIGRLDPAIGAVTVTQTNLIPRQLTIAADGDIWFTARFVPQGVGRLVPATGAVTEFPLTNVGPEGIAASPEGTVWFTPTTKGNIAQITDAGVITEGKVVKNSEPFGITVAPNGDSWYTMFEANKIATLQLR